MLQAPQNLRFVLDQILIGVDALRSQIDELMINGSKHHMKNENKSPVALLRKDSGNRSFC